MQIAPLPKQRFTLSPLHVVVRGMWPGRMGTRYERRAAAQADTLDSGTAQARVPTVRAGLNAATTQPE